MNRPNGILYFVASPFADVEGMLIPSLIGAVVVMMSPAPYWVGSAAVLWAVALPYVLARRKQMLRPGLYAIAVFVFPTEARRVPLLFI